MRDERVWALFGRTPIHFYEYVYVRSGLKSDLKSWVISLPVCVFCLLPLCVCFASCFLFYAKRRRDEALISLGQALSTPTPTTSTGYSTSTGFTKVCYYNGVGGRSAITVPSTSICPLTYSHNISGFTKVCHYPNAFGGPKALTVKSPSICPLTYPR